MKQSGLAKTTFLVPAALALVALAALVLWFERGSDQSLALRVPGTDRGPESETGTNANPVLAGTLTRSSEQPALSLDGQPAAPTGAWPGFRGPNRDAISTETDSPPANLASRRAARAVGD